MSDPKNTIIQEFSTFCSLQDGRSGFSQKPNRKLERVIEASIGDRPPKADKDAWARYFLLGVRQQESELLAALKLTESVNLSAIVDRLVELAPDPNLGVDSIDCHICDRKSEPNVARFLARPEELSRLLLSAYLQKIGYYVAREFYRTRIGGSSRLKRQHPLEDCVQMAQVAASDPANVLKKFDFLRQYSTIQAYANKKLWGCIHDEIRGKDLQAKTKSFSDWGLLKNVSKKELSKAIDFGRQSWQDQYILVWYCYKEIYHPRQSNYSRLPDPNPIQLQQIADRYDRQRQGLGIKETIESTEIFSKLKELARYIREYREKNSELNYEEIEELTENSENSILFDRDPLYQLIRRESNQEIRSIVETAFFELPELEKKAIKLWQGLDLSQSDVIKVLGSQLKVKKQYELSRKIDRSLKPVLKAIVGWYVESSSFEIDRLKLERAIDGKKTSSTKALKQYLSLFCRQEFDRILQAHWQKLEPEERELLHRNANEYGLEEAESKQTERIETEVDRLQALLLDNFQQEIEQQLSVDLDKSDSIEATLTAFVETWLQNRGTLKG